MTMRSTGATSGVGILCLLLLAGCAAKKPVHAQLKERTCMEGSYPIVGVYNGQKVTVCAVVDPKTHQVVDIVDVGFRPGDADEDDKKSGKDRD
jgi:uncharacterized protein YcfL